MKTVGIISDTHAALPASALGVLRGGYPASQVLRHVPVDDPSSEPFAPAPCDLIAHAGDIGNATEPSQEVLDALGEVAPVVAVLGNCDYPVYSIGGEPVGRHAVFAVEDVGFAMLHEPESLRAAVKGAGPTQPAFIKPAPRVLVHGHTHLPKVLATAASVTVCPGSVSRPKQGNPPTIAILKVDAGRLLGIDIVAV